LWCGRKEKEKKEKKGEAVMYIHPIVDNYLTSYYVFRSPQANASFEGLEMIKKMGDLLAADDNGAQAASKSSKS